MLKKPLKFVDTDPDVDDFQNLINYRLSEDNLLHNFHEDSICSFNVKLLTDRETGRKKHADKQTNAA